MASSALKLSYLEILLIRISSNFKISSSTIDEVKQEIRDNVKYRIITEPKTGGQTTGFFRPKDSLFSEELGLNVVPPTIMRNGPYGPGSIQLWIENAEEVTDEFTRSALITPVMVASVAAVVYLFPALVATAGVITLLAPLVPVLEIVT